MSKRIYRRKTLVEWVVDHGDFVEQIWVTPDGATFSSSLDGFDFDRFLSWGGLEEVTSDQALSETPATLIFVTSVLKGEL